MIKKIIAYGMPLMFKVALGILILYFGRIILNRYTSLGTLGIYSFFLILTLQIDKLWTSFNQAWTPKIFSDLSQNSKNVRDNIVSMTFLVSFLYLSGFAFLIIIGELFLFRLLLKEAYTSHIHIFYLLLLVPLFDGIYTVGYPLYYYRNKTKRILYISLLLAFVEIPVTFWGVKHFGENGAAVSIALITAMTVSAYLYSFKTDMQIPLKIINWTILLAAFMTIAVAFLLKTSSSLLFLIFIVTAACIAFLWGKLYTYKDDIINLFNEMRWKIVR